MGERGEGGNVTDRVWAVLQRGELARRLVHASGTGLPALYLLELAAWRTVAILFVVGAVIALGLEAFRLIVGLDWRIYDRLTREYEQENVAGYALYFLSSAPVALLFEPRIAAPAILMLTLGDPISGLLSSSGTAGAKAGFVLLAMFGVCTLLAAPFVTPIAAILGGMAATVADGIKPVIRGYVVDDNLTIPPAAALAMVGGLEVEAVVWMGAVAAA